MEAGIGFSKLILFVVGVLGSECLLVFDRRLSAFVCG